MPDLSQCSDQTLYEQLGGAKKKAGPAFSELYDRYSSRVYSYCRRFMGEEEAARDIFQEAFTRLFETARKKQPVHNVPAYLLRIARNLCLNEKKKSGNISMAMTEMQVPSRDKAYEQVELLGLIDSAVETLPAECREAFILKAYSSMSYNDIAEIAGVSMTAARSRIFRARSMLRELLSPYIKDIEKYSEGYNNV